MIVNYVFEQYLHFGYLLKEMYIIFIVVPLEGGHLFAFEKYCDFMQHLNALLIPIWYLISAFGEQGSFSLRVTNCKLSVSISSIFHSCLASLCYQGICVQFLPMQNHNSPLCWSANKNTEWLGEYFPVNSFADQRERCRVSYRRGDTKADESSLKRI